MGAGVLGSLYLAVTEHIIGSAIVNQAVGLQVGYTKAPFIWTNSHVCFN